MGAAATDVPVTLSELPVATMPASTLPSTFAMTRQGKEKAAAWQLVNTVDTLLKLNVDVPPEVAAALLKANRACGAFVAAVGTERLACSQRALEVSAQLREWCEPGTDLANCTPKKNGRPYRSAQWGGKHEYSQKKTSTRGSRKVCPTSSIHPLVHGHPGWGGLSLRVGLCVLMLPRSLDILSP